MDEKSVELLKDREFVGKILKMNNEEEIIDAFRKRGSELTHEDFVGLKGSIGDMLDKIEELDESEIEKVSGGSLTAEAIISLGTLLLQFGQGFYGGYRRVKESKKMRDESQRKAYEAEKYCNQVLISTGAIVIVAGALCYFKKEISGLWRKNSQSRVNLSDRGGEG